jgi:excisionase family DNA binding protein
MTAPLRIAATELDDRRAVTLQEAADTLAASIATVRGLIERGDLQGYRLRGRLRIYVRSIIAYQDRHAVGMLIAPEQPAPSPPRRQGSPEHRESLAFLARLGV